LAKDTRVSVITVQRAYEALERENLIHSRRGKGFFVSELKNTRKKEMARERLLELIEPMLRTAIEEGLTNDEILNEINKILNNI
jgi:GntR family transcriptional regulator